MKLAVFGATGRTGQILLSKALEAGHSVQALARLPEKLAAWKGDYPAGQLEVVQGSAEDFDAVRRTFAGTEAVLNVMAPSIAGIGHIIKAMKESGRSVWWSQAGPVCLCLATNQP